MLKHCKVIAFAWNTCPLYVGGKEVPGATQEYCTLKCVDAGKTGLNALVARKNKEVYTINFMCGDDAELTASLKAGVVEGAPVDLYVERVEVAPFGRIWTSGERNGQDVCDANGEPIKFTSIQVIRDWECDFAREAIRERTRGISHGSMFDWSDEEEMSPEELARKAEEDAAKNPIGAVPVNTPRQQHRR